MRLQRAELPILILGGTGRLGTIVRRFQSPDIKVLWQARRAEPGIDLVWSPEDGLASLQSQLARINVTRLRAVVALWGVVPGKAADLGLNTQLAHVAADLALALQADRVLHCSSAAVYKPGPAPARESDVPAPVSAYGRAKFAMESAVLHRHRHAPQSPQPCILRIGNVIGADALSIAMRVAAHRGTPVTLDRFANGQGPARSFISGSDLSLCLAALVRCDLSALPETVNLAAHQPTSMADLVQEAGMPLAWRPALAGAVPLVALDTTLLRGIIDLGPDSGTAGHLLGNRTKAMMPQ